MYERILDGFSLILRTLRNSVPLCFRQIIIDPLNNSAFSFDLSDIKVRHLQPVFFQHVGLDFFIGCLGFRTGYFKLLDIQIHFNSRVWFALGQKANRFNVTAYLFFTTWQCTDVHFYQKRPVRPLGSFPKPCDRTPCELRVFTLSLIQEKPLYEASPL